MFAKLFNLPDGYQVLASISGPREIDEDDEFSMSQKTEIDGVYIEIAGAINQEAALKWLDEYTEESARKFLSNVILFYREGIMNNGTPSSS